MKIRFLKIAQLELDDIVEYYNNERSGLGYEFLYEVFEAIDRIENFPDAWQPFHKQTRRCLVRLFPMVSFTPIMTICSLLLPLQIYTENLIIG